MSRTRETFENQNQRKRVSISRDSHVEPTFSHSDVVQYRTLIVLLSLGLSMHFERTNERGGMIELTQKYPATATSKEKSIARVISSFFFFLHFLCGKYFSNFNS
ncbi:hypothetical protein P5V15_008480 [Pogonomyrmex californicus]